MTIDDVVAIRARRTAGERITDLAREFGISKAQVSRIATGKRWAA